HTVGAPEADGIDLLERIRLSDEGIVIGNEVARPARAHFTEWSLGRRMADRTSALINVDADHTREKGVVGHLAVAARVRVVATRQTAATVVGVAEYPSTVVSDGLVLLVASPVLVADGGLAVGVAHAAGQAVTGAAAGLWPARRAPEEGT